MTKNCTQKYRLTHQNFNLNYISRGEFSFPGDDRFKLMHQDQLCILSHLTFCMKI